MKSEFDLDGAIQPHLITIATLIKEHDGIKYKKIILDDLDYFIELHNQRPENEEA